MRARPWAAAVILLLPAAGLGAQVRTPDAFTPASTPPARTADGETAQALRSTLASALVPGAGQFMQGRRRWALYLAAEAAAWVVHVDARRDGRRLRTDYRDLAWSAPRGAPSPRIDGDFDYYERMTQWTRSGDFDRDPGTPGLQPERDPSTWNGAQWKRAADFFLQGNADADPSTPGWDEALAFYRDRAYDDRLTWDWTGLDPERERFRGLIRDSDDRFQDARLALGAVVANHLLSAVDAWVTARTGRPSPASLDVGLTPTPSGPVPRLRVRVPLY